MLKSDFCIECIILVPYDTTRTVQFYTKTAILKFCMLDKSVMIANKAFVLRTNEYHIIYGRASQPQAEQPCTGKQFVCDDF
jgi:hypothetical protein